MPDKLAADRIPRACIQCDGTGCTKTSPKMMCARCRGAYYCSKECQKRHWKEEHKMQQCFSYAEVRAKHAVNTETTDRKEEAGPCSICFADPIVPVILPTCQHAFCMACLQEYYQESTRSACCPKCRTDAVAVGEAVMECSASLLCQIKLNNLDEQRKNSMLQGSLMELDNVLLAGKHLLRANLYKAHILAELDRHAQAREILADLQRKWSVAQETNRAMKEYARRGENLDVPEALQLMADFEEFKALGEPPITFEERTRFDAFKAIADLQQRIEDWAESVKTFNEMMRDPAIDAMPEVFRVQIYCGLCQSMYELGDYQRAIKYGNTAIELSRFYPGVHKYVALAHKKTGSLKEAQRLINRAVLYEAPWDDVHRSKLFQMYKELIAETDEASA